MSKGYGYQNQGEPRSMSIGSWFLTLSVAIPWSGVYLVMAWLWK